jgi:hypothetical protein
MVKGFRYKNQAPLHAGNIELLGGWAFLDLLTRLSELVFFWPGNEQGPIKYGQRHLGSSFWQDSPAMLRLPTRDLLELNREPLFCRFNSGSPRWSRGKPSPRGPQTFLPCHKFNKAAGDVIELVFPEVAYLPLSTECRTHTHAAWTTLDSDLT